MPGFLRQLRQDRNLGKVTRIDRRHVAVVNDALLVWTDAMQKRRASMEDFFDEQLVGLVPTDELSFEMMAELDAVAMVRNWAERADTWMAEFESLIPQGTATAVKSLKMTGEVADKAFGVIKEQIGLLNDHATRAIHEAVMRRGDLPAPTRD